MIPAKYMFRTIKNHDQGQVNFVISPIKVNWRNSKCHGRKIADPGWALKDLFLIWFLAGHFRPPPLLYIPKTSMHELNVLRRLALAQKN